MSFAGSILRIFLLIVTCTIGSQGGRNKMAAANFLNNRSSIQSFFLDQWILSVPVPPRELETVYASTLSEMRETTE